jgi:hypothetical protein
MIWVAFRPSDDLVEMESLIGRVDLAEMAETLDKQVKAGIEQ